MISRKTGVKTLVSLPVLALLTQFAFAGTPAEHGSETMRDYQAGGGSPLANVPMHQDINPKAPKMTEAEFEKAKRSTSNAAPAVTACCARVPPASR